MMNAVASRNIKFVSHSDQGGRGDGTQVMVHRGYAYVGHAFSNGFSVIDVRDPKHPKTVNFLAAPPNTRAFHLQTHDNLLLTVNAPNVWTMKIDTKSYFSSAPADLIKGETFTAGLRVFDISQPETPREIAFMPIDGLGPHRIWYVGGRYAYVSVHFADVADHVLAIVDMANPQKPEVVGRFWLPGLGPGEMPTWPKGKRVALHHGLVSGHLFYGAWRDGGLGIVDVSDPRKPKLVCHRNWDPPFGGATHSPLPLPYRNLLVVGDETNFANCSQGLRYTWMFDIREPSNPVSIATFPIPTDADYCKKGGNFGLHNLWENRPEGLQSSRYIFSAYQNAGLRVYDIENQFSPREIGYYVPPDPDRLFDPRPNKPKVVQSADCFVDKQGLIYLTDNNAGLSILQFNGT